MTHFLEYLEYNPLAILLPIGLITVLLSIAMIFNSNKSEENVSENQINKVVNVTITGGIIGLFIASPKNSLNKKIKNENANGWKVIQVIPSEGGNIFLAFLRVFILFATLFLYTPSNGYYIIMERK